MLYIRSIMNRGLQKNLCLSAGISYNDDYMAYLAGESDDGKTVNKYLCILQFSIEKDARIESAAQMPGVDDEEAMIIMARALMSFLYRDCKIINLYASDRVDVALAKKLGFTDNNGKMYMDLEQFYKSPCHHNGKTDN